MCLDIKGDFYLRCYLKNTHIVASSCGKNGSID